MKRVSMALAAITAVLLVGTASAPTPGGTTAPVQRTGASYSTTSGQEPKLTDWAAVGSTLVEELREAPDAKKKLGVAKRITDRLDRAARDGELERLSVLDLPRVLATLLRNLALDDEDRSELDSVISELTGDAATDDSPEPARYRPEPAPAPVRVPRTAAAPVRPQQVSESATLFPGLPADGHAGYATGTVIHADTVEAGGTRLTDTEVAHAAAAFTSEALTDTLRNELSRLVAPLLGAGAGYGRGAGLEIGLAISPDGEAQVVPGGIAEAQSPPTTELVSSEVGPVDIDPAAVASLLRGLAQSRAAAACTTGVDLSFGEGYAADVGLVAAGTDHVIETNLDDPARSVSQTTSRTRLVPQVGAPQGPIAKFGLLSETRQTIAPVTFLDGTPGEFTLEFGGEFVLRATADGKSGEVFYGPGTVEPETPLLTILDGAGDPIVDPLTSQDIFGNEGLEIEIPGVAEIAVGEDPRAIGGDTDSSPTETATLAAGAVDVVRVTLLEQEGIKLADVRVGHMEVATAVPEGGIECGIGLTKVVDNPEVNAGDEFTWTLTVTNPNDCVLSNLKVVDTISTDNPDVRYSIESSEPPADSVTENTLTWNDVGPLPPGGEKQLLIGMKVASDSGSGLFIDNAVATGVCGPAEGEAEAGVGVPLEARVTLELPRVLARQASVGLGELPRTGGLLLGLPALGLLGGSLVLRRLRRHGDPVR